MSIQVTVGTSPLLATMGLASFPGRFFANIERQAKNTYFSPGVLLVKNWPGNEATMGHASMAMALGAFCNNIEISTNDHLTVTIYHNSIN